MSQRARLLPLMVGSLAAFQIACSASSAGGPPSDSATASQSSASLSQVLLVDEGLKKEFDALLESPEISAAGNRLWERLEADPQLSALGNQIIEDVTKRPKFAQFVQRLAAKHPDWGEEEYGAHFERTVDQVTASPRYEALFENAFEQPAIEASVEAWAEHLARATPIQEAVGDLILSPRWRQVWRRRVGPTTNGNALLEKVDAYLGQAEGKNDAQRLGSALVHDPALKQGFIRLLDSPELTEILKRQSLALLSQPQLRERCADILLATFSGAAVDEPLDSLEEILNGKAYAAAVRGTFQELSESEELTQLMAETFAQMINHLEANEQLRKEMSGISI